MSRQVANEEIKSGRGEQAIYSERYVAFVDILGFSRIVRDSVQSTVQATKLAGTLNRIANRSEPPGIELGSGDDFKAQSFSDCTVLSENASDQGLLHLLDVLTIFALDLMANGILVRGGVARGPLYHKEGVVFGPALLDAYALESTIAKFPRILIDRRAHVDFKRIINDDELGSARREKIKLSGDGPPFLHVFEPFRFLTEKSPSWLLETRNGCNFSIQFHLDHSIYEPRIYEKLRWLAIYWNSSGLPIVRLPATM
jgi:hypothetical protein